MVDAVSTKTLVDGPRNLVMQFTNISDGTGEAAVKKVDVSALSAGFRAAACSRVRIERIVGSTSGMSVQLLWDATTDTVAALLPSGNDFDLDYTKHGGITNNAGTGITGDIMITTVGHTAADTYDITVHMVKSYG